MQHAQLRELAEVSPPQQDPAGDASGQVIELIFGRWRSQILYAGIKLGVFDALASGAKNAARVASELELDAGLLYRLMRALGSLGLLSEGKTKTFSLTRSGQLLREDHPHSLRAMTLLEEGPEHYAAWKHLTALIAKGARTALPVSLARLPSSMRREIRITLPYSMRR